MVEDRREICKRYDCCSGVVICSDEMSEQQLARRASFACDTYCP